MVYYLVVLWVLGCKYARFGYKKNDGDIIGIYIKKRRRRPPQFMIWDKLFH